MTQTRLGKTNWNGGRFWRFGQKPVFLKHSCNKSVAYILCISLRTRLCWLSLAGNSVICILILDFVYFAIAQPHFDLQCYIDRLRVIYFIIFHSKRQHKHGLRTVNISQHCTFVSGVSLTRARVKYYLTLIIFAKGNRSPGKNRVTWSVPGCQEMLLNGCWMKSFVIDVYVI